MNTMLIDIDEDYVKWVKQENAELFAQGRDEKVVLQNYINEVLSAHHQSWLADEEQ